MKFIEIANGEFINVEKYFAFELVTHGKSEEDVIATVSYSVLPIVVDYKSGLSLRDYLLSSAEKREWVYIRTSSSELILNIEQICKLELADTFWYVETGEHVCLQNCTEQELGFDEDGVSVMPDNVHMKPTSFMRIKAELNPFDISVTD